MTKFSSEFDTHGGKEPYSMLEAINRGMELFRASFGRIYGKAAAEAYVELFAGYEPKDILKAAERIARSGDSSPTPHAWLAVAGSVAWAEGRYSAAPWAVPPWATRSSVYMPRWGMEEYGGYYALPNKDGNGRTYAFNEHGVANQTGTLGKDGQGFLVWAPIGERPEDQAAWNSQENPLRQQLRELIVKLGSDQVAIKLSKNLPTGMVHISGAMVEALGEVAGGMR